MKYKKLVGKVDEIAEKREQGKKVESSKIEKVRQLLTEKKARYLEKLEATEDEGKRSKLATRLRVVEAQLQKSERLLG